MSGSVRLIAQLVIAAGVLGFVASFVGQWLYLLLVFPVLIGLALGAVGRVGIRSGKVRNPWLAGGAGFLAGVLAMTTMHYFDYLRFDREFPPAQRAALRAVLGQLQAKMGARQPGLRNLPRNPAVFQAIKVHDFPSYVDYTAHIGVTISHGGGRNGGMNLGYVGSYIYWLVEMFIVAGIAFSIMRVQASEPFCTTCRNWKQKRSIGTLSLPASPVVEAVRDGNVNALWDHDPRSYGGPLAVLVSSCQQCGHEAPADVLVQHVTTDKKGQVKRRNLIHVSYPGEAAQAFEVLFQK